MLSLQDARDYVRSFLDSDEDELPNILVDPWILEGLSRIQRLPFISTYYAKSWTLTSTPSSQEYPLDGIAADIDEIVSVQGPNWLLRQRPHEILVDKYAFSTAGTDNPTEYSVFAGSLFLWMTPSGTDTYVLRGYRTPLQPSAASDVFDVPPEFHSVIAEYALARAYEQFDDPDMATEKFNRCTENIDIFSRRYRRGAVGGALVIGEGVGILWPHRLLWPWE
jgi:hypothetical protein